MSESDVTARVLAYARRRAEEGQYPYEGQWRDESEIRRLIRRRQWHAWAKALELLVLLSAVYAVGGLSYLLISLLCY